MTLLTLSGMFPVSSSDLTAPSSLSHSFCFSFLKEYVSKWWVHSECASVQHEIRSANAPRDADLHPCFQFCRFKSPSQLRPQEEVQHKHIGDIRPWTTRRSSTAAARTRSLTSFPPATLTVTLTERTEKLPLESVHTPVTGNPARYNTPAAADVSPDFSQHLMLWLFIPTRLYFVTSDCLTLFCWQETGSSTETWCRREAAIQCNLDVNWSQWRLVRCHVNNK